MRLRPSSFAQIKRVTLPDDANFVRILTLYKCQQTNMTDNSETPPSPWFLYVLETKYKHLYTGISLNWQRRLEEHSSNSLKCAKALKGKGPLTLKYCIELPDRRTAMQAELWLKKQSKSSKVAIITQRTALPFTHSLITC